MFEKQNIIVNYFATYTITAFYFLIIILCFFRVFFYKGDNSKNSQKYTNAKPYIYNK